MDMLFPARSARTDAARAGSPELLMISRSWQRSVDRYGLDPGNQEPPRVLSASALRDHVDPMEPLLELARGPLDTLFEQVRDAGYVVLMTDAEGVATRMIHDPRLDRDLRRAGLYPGSLWQEHTEGTCAVPLSALEKVALTVHHSEHFREINRALTCSAAPVLAPDGRVLGVIDASALSSPSDRRSQLLVLQMVRNAARVIEDAYFLQAFAEHWVLRIGPQAGLVEVMTDALLAVDGDGRVVGANSRFVAGSGLSPADLCGQPLEQVAGVGFEALCAASARDPRTPLGLRLSWRAQPCYALLSSPWRPRFDGAARAESPALPAALAALAGSDTAMQTNARRALRLFDKRVNLLLQGESGTGKEVFAKALHEASARASGPFVAINCAAIPESLIESELFGYNAGAFTGAARHGVRGRIAQAHRGTLFLDEIGDMPLGLQTRLLRVLAEREVQALGAQKAMPLDVQVICATHRDLGALVEDGAFRLDLLYRINGVTLRLPGLREREDRDMLIERVSGQEAAALGLGAVQITDQARRMLVAHDWPGNFRELRNTMRAMLALVEDGVIDAELVDATIHQRRTVGGNGCGGARDVAGHRVGMTEQACAMRSALESSHGNVSEAARRLGIGRATMYRRMQRLGIVPPNRLFDPGDTDI